ncbi:DNA-binding FrmR family transcriptional regulator [Litorimonas taeanensis]|uniref:DNA-binding FrmR family transcriptional regulator n=1 Tax=Litorimonas taeanensis TaxID=568099 RepID=A0A420WFL6_9PROT|nr:metal-sensitive transcriptional regulator [Litorimonas taeanensis]RKQ69766.1 DNA-binding FrmR family transcriptional regulator [Litorimonas taeanensis]
MDKCHKSRSERRQGCRKRLARIEGQVRGLQKMIDEDRYCIDILVQTKAVISAIARVEGELLKDHIDHCLTEAIMSGDDNERDVKVAELVDLLSKR